MRVQAAILGVLAWGIGMAGPQAQAPFKLAMPGTAGPYTVFNEMKGFIKGGIKVHFREDSRGAIWAYTQKGLWRFNGTAFEKQDPGAVADLTTIQDLFCDARGNVWVATRDGLVLFDGSTWKNLGGRLDPGDPSLRSIECGSAGAAWFQAGRKAVRVGMYRYEWKDKGYFDLGVFSRVTEDNRFDQLSFVGRDWCRVENGTVTVLRKDALPPKETRQAVGAMAAVTPSGAVWSGVDGRLSVWKGGAFADLVGMGLPKGWEAPLGGGWCAAQGHDH